MTRLIKIVLAIAVFLVLHMFVEKQFESEGYLINEWTLSANDEIRSITMPFAQDNKIPQIYTLEKQVDILDYDTLVIPPINCYAIKVYDGQQLIYRRGSFEEPSSIIWNQIHTIQLEAGDSSVRDIKIQAFALHDMGIKNSIYLANYEEIYKKIDVQNFLNVYVIYLLIGGYIGIGALLVVIALKSKKHYNKTDVKLFLYFGTSCFAFALFLLDSMYRISTGSLVILLLVRKLNYVGLYVGVYTLLKGVRKYMYSKETPRWVFFLFTGICVLILSANSFYSLHRYTAYLGIVLIAILIYILIISLLNDKNTMIFSSMFLFLACLQSILIVIGLINDAYLFHYGLFIYMMSISYIIAYKYEAIEKESIELNRKVLIDPLTKAYNRAYINDLIMQERDMAVFIDLDRFKIFNDTHGHDEGDALLKYLVNLFKKVLGKEAEIIRYGGDEFVLILRNYEVASVESLMGAINKQLKDRYSDADFSYGFIEYEGDLAKTLIEADHLMYSMKKAKH